jgi:aldehyde:ferredoxin oxidoreductase
MNRELFEELKDDYYEQRGWDEKGVPKDDKLEELGLERLK